MGQLSKEGARPAEALLVVSGPNLSCSVLPAFELMLSHLPSSPLSLKMGWGKRQVAFAIHWPAFGTLY